MVSFEQLFKVKVTSKGQVVIPKPLREFYHIREGEEILMIPLEKGVLIKREEGSSELRGLLKELDVVDVIELEDILAEAKRSLTKMV
ncbi:MAG: AbrB/MazE/SpoVT family DNA-binding domain-containing protein [Candidatus Freyarchaeum deiterrae]